MRILISNDDGITSPGLYALYSYMKQIGLVHVVAPEAEQSATGHAITLEYPLRVKDYAMEDGFIAHAVTGTPADCTKIALRALLPEKPDILISGINRGANLGVSVIYSGTVSAATEGCILGIPSIAISLTSFKSVDYEVAGTFAVELVQWVFKNSLPKGVLLNVNIPAVSKEQIQGVKVTRLSRSRFEEFFDKRVDPQGRVYYWLSGNVLESSTEADLDDNANKKNYITVTPLHFDLTAKEYLDHFKAVEKIY